MKKKSSAPSPSAPAHTTQRLPDYQQRARRDEAQQRGEMRDPLALLLLQAHPTTPCGRASPRPAPPSRLHSRWRADYRAYTYLPYSLFGPKVGQQANNEPPQLKLESHPQESAVLVVGLL
eukprot:scaffold27560_cov142-Isochrysis_galbana.AAC.3